jgi:KamA family protein
VILSGGDPLVLDDDLLAELARRLAEIPHLGRLRVHSRLPIVIPQRITDELLGWLRGTRLAPIVVVHVNHPAEIDGAVQAALGRLVDAGVPVLSQSVLLRGVNDRIETLAELYQRLVDLRVIPYYLHQLDRVAGAAHFEVPESTGRQLLSQLRALLPGYAVPRYVRETPGEPNKRVLG